MNVCLAGTVAATSPLCAATRPNMYESCMRTALCVAAAARGVESFQLKAA